MAMTHEQSRLDERAAFEREWTSARRREKRESRADAAPDAEPNRSVSALGRIKQLVGRWLGGVESERRPVASVQPDRELYATFLDPIMKSAREAFAHLGSLAGPPIAQSSSGDRSASSLPEWTMQTICAPIPIMPGMTAMPPRMARPDAPTGTWPALPSPELASGDEETRLMRVPQITAPPEPDQDR